MTNACIELAKTATGEMYDSGLNDWPERVSSQQAKNKQGETT
jgi:hypothetical protein